MISLRESLSTILTQLWGKRDAIFMLDAFGENGNQTKGQYSLYSRYNRELMRSTDSKIFAYALET